MSAKKELSEGLADGDKLSIIKVLKDSFPNISKAITGISSAWSSGTTIMSKASGVMKIAPVIFYLMYLCGKKSNSD